jgi:hypothetical protein
MPWAIIVAAHTVDLRPMIQNQSRGIDEEVVERLPLVS